jgi:acyl-CoA-binding protein
MTSAIFERRKEKIKSSPVDDNSSCCRPTKKNMLRLFKLYDRKTSLDIDKHHMGRQKTMDVSHTLTRGFHMPTTFSFQ